MKNHKLIDVKAKLASKKYRALFHFSFLIFTFISACSQAPASIVQHSTTSAAKKGGGVKNPYKIAVQKGDTLYSIARKNNLEIRDLIEANKLRPPYVLIAGQTVKLPKPTFHIVGESDNLYAISRSYGVDIGRLAQKNNIQPPYNITRGQKLLLPSPAENIEVAAEKKTYDYNTSETAITSDVVSSTELAPLGSKPVESKILPPLSEEDDSPFAYQQSSAVKSNNLSKVAKAADDSDDSPFSHGSAAEEAKALTNKPVRIAQKQTAEKSAKSEKAGKQTELFMEDNDTQTLPALKSTQGKAVEVAEVSPLQETKNQDADKKKIAETDIVPAKSIKKAAKESTPVFHWPVSGKIISRFGPKKGGLYNDGINIAAKEGAPIKAADDGDVVYSGNELRGYGNMLLIRHKDGYLTAYAHTDDFLVKKGDVIKKGQVIAHVGQTGHVSSPQLHFSIRQGRKAIDPEKYLPG